ncbi:membrane protein [Gordonia phage Phendrix]|uniref:Membrane protein n=1 Tax=Gordonia phage Phendrix TaxID=2593335 RepID=A0A514U114_9CAUD|nr:membrane protein [Gordonia phage Phendrix]QDK02642.1 membrane protein [Gordonia phage Phendrix]
MGVFGYKVSEIRRAVVSVLGFAIILITSLGSEFGEWFSNDTALTINSVVGFLTAVSVYLVKNEKTIDALDGVNVHRR